MEISGGLHALSARDRQFITREKLKCNLRRLQCRNLDKFAALLSFATNAWLMRYWCPIIIRRRFFLCEFYITQSSFCLPCPSYIYVNLMYRRHCACLPSTFSTRSRLRAYKYYKSLYCSRQPQTLTFFKFAAWVINWWHVMLYPKNCFSKMGECHKHTIISSKMNS